MLAEMFGDPIDDVFGTKVGNVKDITSIGAVGVRGKENPMLEVDVCPSCGMMPIGGKCGCPDSDVCPKCGMMPAVVDAPCSCGMGMYEGLQTCGKCGMSEATCECGGGVYEVEEASKAYGGDEPDYANIDKETAKKRLDTIKDKYGSDWKDMLKAFDWASNPAAALSTLHKKAYGKWPSEK